MALTTLVAGNTITAAGLNDNFSFCVLTDTAKTISVTHTYSASQTFTGGWTAATTCTITATSGTLLSLRYDGSNHLAVTVDSAGAVTYNATGTGPHHVFADRMVFNGALRLTTDPTASPEAAINITTGFSLATGTTQIGVNVNPVYSSAATVAGYGVYGKVQTAVASFTMTSAMSFYAANPTAGAGSTITSAYGVYVEAITTGGTNNYAICGAVAFRTRDLHERGARQFRRGRHSNDHAHGHEHLHRERDGVHQRHGQHVHVDGPDDQSGRQR